MADKKQLQMSFDLNTIDHLGIKMYSRIPNAIAELIANAYDADATRVDIKLYDKTDKRIEVLDDGHGMDFDEVNNKFLRIGRNRREDKATISPGGRKATGKKGLGKLALFGIGNSIEVTTIKKGFDTKLKFMLSWTALQNTEGGNYLPERGDDEKCNPEEQGTSIILRDLRRKSSFKKEDLAASISRLFDCFDEGFRCFISLNDDEEFEIDNKLKFKDIDEQFSWFFPNNFETVKPDYPYKKEISGKIISTPTPLSPGLRGITLFANGRLVNAPEFFGIIESSNVFSYLTGWLNIDFIDDIKEDVISTNRQALTWDIPVTIELKEFIVAIIRHVIIDWRKKRAEEKNKKLKEKKGIVLEERFKTFPDKLKESSEKMFDALEKDDGISTETQEEVAEIFCDIVPEYPLYHWRHLHDEIKRVSKRAYINKDYYGAFFEAVKHYANSVRDKAGNVDPGTDDYPMMEQVFGMKQEKPRMLSVTKIHKRPNGLDFHPETIKNVEGAQKELSQGVMRGCRNVLGHQVHVDLEDSDLFSEKDCLDGLSLLSHLFRRLDDAEKP